MRKVYFDHAATTPIHPKVVEAMLPYLKEQFGNPLSLHSFGEGPREAVEEARAKVADLIGARPNEIYFTASGSEANNMAVKGIALMNRQKGQHMVVSAIEHQSVLNATQTLEKLGFEVTQVPVDQHGLVDPDDVVAAIRDDTTLVSVMHANNEIGTIEPVAEIARAVKEKRKGITFHTDAVATVGTLPVDVKELGVDLLSLAGSQFYGPKGAGALFIRKGTRLMPLIDGGIQERGRRAGTENVPAIVGLGVAAELAKESLAERAERLIPLRDRLVERLTSEIDRVYLTGPSTLRRDSGQALLRTGHPTMRLPGHVSVCVEFIEGESMLLMLNMQGIAASSGSTCTSRALKASHVLMAIGLEAALAQGSLVFTLGESNTIEDVDYVAEVLPPIVERLRQMSPLYEGK
ncbi:MAG: aminotransferase class V-fold PLP-dependent enzyme [Anaerolineae bacterium]|nr:aminotransferase class V-fold PLP-dependent enzyme [Anaerolineae bacterium]